MYKIVNLDFRIEELGRNRTIRIYLPQGYSEEKEKRYPVIYMHDGHNLFYKETSSFNKIWDVHNVLKEFQEETGKGCIVVGIDCNNETVTGRFDEYSPWVNEELSEIISSREISEAGGEGALYVDFIVDTLKPYIDKHYRTSTERKDTFIAGSSMGGFISLYAAFKYPKIFAAVGAFSTAVWFKKDKLFEFIRGNFVKDMKVYLDIGTNETSDENNSKFNQIYLDDTLDLGDLLMALGMPEYNLKLIVDDGGIHSEEEWKKRFPEFLRFIFK